MQDLFGTVLKMSLTASYVILAVLLVRFFLQKAPKKYAYLLWVAVGFRLVFPHSFTFDFSLLRLKELFSSTDSAGLAAGSGMFPTSAIEPDPSPYFNTPTEDHISSGTFSGIWSPFPEIVAEEGGFQPEWVMFAALIWLVGIVVLLTYSGAALYKVNRKTATAIKLEGNIYESDAICSPFILGFFKPRIYIPFGLGQAEKAYILMHERYHLRRRDHWIQPIAFLILAVHWFNPLVWAAYIGMMRDMEMSCDEKVLTEAGPGITKPYSLSLLSFASNRRIPTASPLAFGESSVRKRIINVLSFKKANKWVSTAAAILTVMAIVACTADPGAGSSGKRLQAEKGSAGVSGTTAESEVRPANEAQVGDKAVSGSYRFEKKLYLNPLSSFYPGPDFVEYYSFRENSFTITDQKGEQTQLSARYEKSVVEPDDFIEAYGNYALKSLIPDIGTYQTRLQYDLDRAHDDQRDFYRLYIMDGEMWLAHFLNDVVWTVYQIAPYYGNLPMKESADTGESNRK
ncbi:M56 family metallopeptidase [Paenibacillus sp. CAU 1782]